MKVEKPEHGKCDRSGTTIVSSREWQTSAAHLEDVGDETSHLLEQVLCRENLIQAHARVVRNGGAPGVDGMTVKELMPYCKTHWMRIKEELLSERYVPQPVLKVEIPKPGGGKRSLGIPTVLDRFIQQALLQVLQPIFDPTFSEDSFGFRPGRSAHDAILRAREHIQEGHEWAVDMDLEKFFDRVNHDVLMARVARRIKDKRVLRLLRQYLQAGVMEGGNTSVRTEGTPQGGPLSPLLSNILLDDLDKELEKRGHRFVRYADDFIVYVRSRKAGNRVMSSITRFLNERLHLHVNLQKSAVDIAGNRIFLGYRIYMRDNAKISVPAQACKRLKSKICQVLRRGRGQNIYRTIEELQPIIRGWTAYFRLSDSFGSFREMDKWLRHKIRDILWRQWKKPATRARKLMELGMSEEMACKTAYAGFGPWRSSGSTYVNRAIPNNTLHGKGLPSFVQEYRRLKNAT